MVPNLFLTVAHFHFENFPWPNSQSIAQELDLNFHQSWIRLKRFLRPKTGDFQNKKKVLHQNSNGFSGRKQVISNIKKKGIHHNSNGFSSRKQVIFKKKKVFTKNQTVFSGQKQVISKKKRSSPKFKGFFWPKTGDLQKKKCKYDFFKPKCSVVHCKILLRPTDGPWPTGWKPLSYALTGLF